MQVHCFVKVVDERWGSRKVGASLGAPPRVAMDASQANRLVGL